MPIPIFDSRDLRCKSPFGAVKAGETVSFTLFPPPGTLGAELLVFPADQWDSPRRIPFSPALSEGRPAWQGSFVPQEPALLFYRFELFTEDGSFRLLPDGQNQGILAQEGDALWQLTVYDGAMSTPAPLQKGVLYQIFPDRFCSSGSTKENVPADRKFHGDWLEFPQYLPDPDGEYRNNDYYGGDLKGIREKLPYLSSLGVTALYLNPVFEAHSNHRYNTADYTKIDPMLGTQEDFSLLCQEAKALGMAVFLDGVFSHTGSDSIYFNREGRYGEGGAYRDPQSPYREWYRFRQDGSYQSWWNFDSLPEVEEENPSYQAFILDVVERWLGLGASGFRLDVADELPDSFLDRLRERVKAVSPEAALLGEVWEDASNKVSYGQRRRYLLGRQLDSVMNYPFQSAILNFVRFGGGEGLLQGILTVLEHYPAPVIRGLMNTLSTHDTPRAISLLAGVNPEGHDRVWQANHHFLSLEEYAAGKRRLCLASAIQYTLPGIPCLYYGDEAGLSGLKDPFNRTTYPWGLEDTGLLAHYRRLGQLRRHPALAENGSFVPLFASREGCAYLRQAGEHRVILSVNRGSVPLAIPLPAQLRDGCELFAGPAGKELPGESFQILATPEEH